MRLARCAHAGIGNLNIDLIAGLSGQTEASWRESLDWIERLAPAHVSVYMLEVDEDSRLGKEILRGGARYGAAETPGDDRDGRRSTRWPSSGWRRWASRATRSPISRGRASNRGTT